MGEPGLAHGAVPLHVEQLDGAVGRLLGGEKGPEPTEELLLALVAVHLAVLEVLLLDGQVVLPLLTDQQILRVNIRRHTVSVPNLDKFKMIIIQINIAIL